MKAQTIIDESQEPEWTAEDFQKWLYNNTPEEDENSTISPLLSEQPFSSSGDDIQFKFNYQDKPKTKSVVEEIDIPVY